MIGRAVKDSISMGDAKLQGQVASKKKMDGVSALRKLLPIVWGWINLQQTSRSNRKRLHVAESVSLGEKRFVAVVHVDGLQFLVGGSANSMALLAQLGTPEKFSHSIETAMESAIPTLKAKRIRTAQKTVDRAWGNA